LRLNAEQAHFKFMIKTLYRLILSITFVLTIGCVSTPTVQMVVIQPSTAPLKLKHALHRPSVAIALGGGAARGFAHVGVLKALEENGIIPDVIIGTSAGSVVGALYAGGIRGQALVDAASELSRDKLTDWSFPNRGVIKGELLQQYVNEKLDFRSIEDLEIPFAAIATELKTGRRVAFNQGNVGIAVRASSAVPGIVQPVIIDGRDYVDGGIVSQVPVEYARELGADIVIAVDVTRSPQLLSEFPDTIDVVYQSLLIVSKVLVDYQVKSADIVIRPHVGHVSIADFEQRLFVIDEGYRSAEVVIPYIKELIREKTGQAVN
jgi:NTE family protein